MVLTEQQLFEEFHRYAVVIARDGAPYLETKHALDFVAACQQNDLAVLGMDGHVADRKERRLDPRDDLIVDCSGIEVQQVGRSSATGRTHSRGSFSFSMNKSRIWSLSSCCGRLPSTCSRRLGE